MRNSTSVKVLYTYFPLVIIIVILAYTSSSLSLRTVMDDDMYFVKALANNSLKDFLTIRYETWSGRFSIEAILVTTINYPWFWRISIPLCIMLLGFSIQKLSSNSNFSSWHLLLSIILFFCMPDKVLKDGSLWITGFYNYLLPVSLGFFSISVLFKNKDNHWLAKTIALLALFVSCNNEQMAVISIISISIFMLLKRDVSFFTISYLFFAIASTCALLLAPGNAIRFLAESRRIPEFSYYGLVDKIGLGLDRLSSTISGSNLFITILSLVAIATLLKFRKGEIRPVDVLSIVVVLLFNILKVIGFTSYGFMNNGDWSNIYFYFRYILSLMFYVSLIYIYARSLDYMHDEFDLVSLLTLIFAPASIMMIGFSPTVYASGDRVLFLFYCMLTIPLLRSIKKV